MDNKIRKMDKILSTPTKEDIINAYIIYLEKIRNTNPKVFALDTEILLLKFIHKYYDVRFTSIYDQLDHNYYDRLRKNIPTDSKMREADDNANQIYTLHLGKYSTFLDSKEFHSLSNAKRGIDSNIKKLGIEQNTFVVNERELTEGEKKHLEYEQAHRNPALRRACIQKYGYQCQCCGMDFASLYGEELGAGFIEVHHLKMISNFENERPDNYLENLVPLCSNCHSMIHHGKNGPLTLRELRLAYKGEKKEIKVWKED